MSVINSFRKSRIKIEELTNIFNYKKNYINN